MDPIYLREKMCYIAGLMSYRAAIIYLWDLFETGRASGRDITEACKKLDKHAGYIYELYEFDAAPVWFKSELDELAKLT